MKPDFSKASPRPWKAEEHRILFGAHNGQIGEMEYFIGTKSRDAWAIDEANAALAVHAVNCHEELVAALHGLLVVGDAKAKADARAALSRARGKEAE